jgi:hypothetical protein
MKYLIKIADTKHTYGCVIESDKEPYEALFRFLFKYYPTIVGFQESGNEGEYEKVLKDKAFSGVLLVEGETECVSKIGVISITAENENQGIPFTGEDLTQWVVNAREVLDEEYYNHAMNMQMAQEYANTSPERRKLLQLGYHTEDGWKPYKELPEPYPINR